MNGSPKQANRVDAGGAAETNRPSPEESNQFINTTAVQGDVLDIPGAPNAAVIGQNVDIILDEVDRELRHKISQCFSYAAAVADGPDTINDIGPSTDMEKWYTRYFWALRNTGLWIQSIHPRWTTFSAAGTEVNVHTAILSMISGMFGAGVTTTIIEGALKQLTSPANANAPWFTLFQSASKSLSIPSCQISVVSQPQGKPVTLDLLIFALEVQHLDGQLLFFKFSSDQVRFKSCRYEQTIDDKGLRNISALADAITARVGVPGPILMAMS